MTDILALENLYNEVVARFELEGTNVPNVFGWREPTKKDNPGPARICWVPGDESGNTGAILPPRSPGRNPRPLATLDELCTIIIYASDQSQGENEMLQYRAVRLLYDAWYRAAHLAVHGTWRIVSNRWNTSKNERRHGAELRLVIAVQAMIPDAAHKTAPVDAQAEIAVHDLDQTDNLVITAETSP